MNFLSLSQFPKKRKGLEISRLDTWRVLIGRGSSVTNKWGQSMVNADGAWTGPWRARYRARLGRSGLDWPKHVSHALAVHVAWRAAIGLVSIGAAHGSPGGVGPWTIERVHGGPHPLLFVLWLTVH
jgi:hypothetical protein